MNLQAGRKNMEDNSILESDLWTINRRITDHKRELNERIDKMNGRIDRVLEKQDVQNVNLSEVKDMVHGLKVDVIERVCSLEKKQLIENGKLWAKIGALVVAIGGIYYIGGHLLEKMLNK